MSRYKLPSLGENPLFGRSKSSAATTFGFAAFLFECVETYRQRRALAALDERMLKDIGLSRCDVEEEISRPVWR